MNLIKIIASFCVVWFHTGVLLFGFRPSGVLIFAFISGYFIAVSKSQSLTKKVNRLVIPFIFWSCVYGCINLYLSGSIFREGNNLLTGPDIHLWYLPFVIMFTIVLFNLKRFEYCDLLALFTGLIIWLIDIEGPAPTGQYLNAAPILLIGFYIGRNYKIKTSLFNAPIINKVAGLTFGVYLAHPVTILVLRHIGLTGVMFPILSFIVTLLGVYIASAILPKQFINKIV